MEEEYANNSSFNEYVESQDIPQEKDDVVKVGSLLGMRVRVKLSLWSFYVKIVNEVVLVDYGCP